MGNRWEYQIRVEGMISSRWLAWFDGLDITSTHGEHAGQADEVLAITKLTGVLPDEAALAGLLQRLYTLGLPLVQVTRKEAESLDDTARDKEMRSTDSDTKMPVRRDTDEWGKGR